MLRSYWLITLISCLVQALAESDCYSDDLSPYKYFASKTSYETVRSKKLRIDDVPNCEAVLVWGLFRHGTRYPHDFEIKEQMSLTNLRDAILRNHDISPHKGQLCFEDLQLLRDWNYSVSLNDADYLTSAGVNELYLLGKRLKTDFPLLNTNYSEDKFKIRFTGKIRTKQSADAFTRGLFGAEIQLPDSFVNGTLLEPNGNCTTFKASTDNKELQHESQRFRNGYIMTTLIAEVSKKLGFDSQLTYKNVQDMYDMCRFDNAWHPNDKSPWCSAFTNEQLKVMEYDEDLSYYYSSGYGNPLTQKLGCPLVRDLIETMNRRTLVNTTEETGPTTILYFTHSLTLRSLLIGLGMAQDSNPLTSDFTKTSDKRQWRTSFITPFAGNLVAVLYKCGDDYKVIFYLNEQYVDYKGCNVGLCNWTYIYDRFLQMIDPKKCNLDFCSLTSSASSFSLSFVIPILITLYLYINKIV